MTRGRLFRWSESWLAVALALAMSVAWTWARWADLATGALPDTDDLARLQQIRDWLNGAAFSDLTQHRFGVAGVPMHWSRLPDLIPGAIILTLRPLLGVHSAELVAVLLWPAGLLAAVLKLSAVLARALSARASDAMLVALLAYPLTTLFAPGRIDHHGLQIVLLLGCCAALLGRPTAIKGVAAGVASVASLTIGMETVPLLAVAIGAALVRWSFDRSQDVRITGLAVSLLASTAASLLLATDSWRYAACDGFNRTSWTAAAIACGSLAVAVLASTRLSWRGRLSALAVAGVVTLGLVALLVPECASPYGAVDPTLARLWLSQVGEAQGVLAADPRWAVAYVGPLLAGVLAGVWCDRHEPQGDRRVLLAVSLVALALTCVQLRAAYGGIAVSVPLLAEAIGRARRSGILAALTMRVAAAGIVYPVAAAALPVSDRQPAASCDTTAAVAALRDLPPGRVLTDIDLGPVLLATTPHQVLAAPYHRNVAGNLAALRFAGADANERSRIAHHFDVTYWVGCGNPAGLVPTGIPSLWHVR